MVSVVPDALDEASDLLDEQVDGFEASVGDADGFAGADTCCSRAFEVWSRRLPRTPSHHPCALCHESH